MPRQPWDRGLGGSGLGLLLYSCLMGMAGSVCAWCVLLMSKHERGEAVTSACRRGARRRRPEKAALCCHPG